MQNEKIDNDLPVATVIKKDYEYIIYKKKKELAKKELEEKEYQKKQEEIIRKNQENVLRQIKLDILKKFREKLDNSDFILLDNKIIISFYYCYVSYVCCGLSILYNELIQCILDIAINEYNFPKNTIIYLSEFNMPSSNYMGGEYQYNYIFDIEINLITPLEPRPRSNYCLIQ